MNSMTIDNNKCADKCCTCNENKVILKSGNSISTILQLPLVPGTMGIPVTISQVTVDTSCLYKPQIKLDFMVNIAIPTGVTITNLILRVFKVCNNRCQRMPVGSDWYFNNISWTGSTVFSFFIYDYDTFKSEYCTYVLEAVPYS